MVKKTDRIVTGKVVPLHPAKVFAYDGLCTVCKKQIRTEPKQGKFRIVSISNPVTKQAIHVWSNLPICVTCLIARIKLGMGSE